MSMCEKEGKGIQIPDSTKAKSNLLRGFQIKDGVNIYTWI